MAWRATVLVVAITAASATAAPAPAPSPSDLAADAALIGDLARHFQIDAVCLVREEPLNASRHVHLATLQKELSKRSVRNHVASMENFYKKRMKLKHYLFRTLYVITLPDKTGQHFLVEHPPYTTWRKVGNKTEIGGLVGEIWTTLEKFLNFRTGVYIKHPGFGYAGWWGLLKPFWVDFWLAAVGCVVAVAATLAVATLAAPGVPTPGAADALRCFLDFLFRTVAIFCGQESI
ncbi:Protein of unknown function, partial [Gryllus bimaculatus]